MAVAKEALWALKTVCLAAIDIALGIPAFFVLLVAFSYEIGTFVVIGVATLISRYVFLAMIPFILKHTDIFLDILNASIAFADIFFDICILIIDGIIGVATGITDIINALSRLFSGHKVINNLAVNFPKFIKIKTVSRHSFKEFLIRIETNCPAYNSAEEIFYYIARNVIGPAFCPPVRYLYPSKPFYNAADKLLGWSYAGSADPTPGVPDTNCIDASDETADYVCVGLGVGYIILEIFLPMILGIVFVATLGKGLSRLAVFAFWALGKTLETGFEIVIAVLKRLEL